MDVQSRGEESKVGTLRSSRTGLNVRQNQNKPIAIALLILLSEKKLFSFLQQPFPPRDISGGHWRRMGREETLIRLVME